MKLDRTVTIVDSRTGKMFRCSDYSSSTTYRSKAKVSSLPLVSFTKVIRNKVKDLKITII